MQNFNQKTLMEIFKSYGDGVDWIQQGPMEGCHEHGYDRLGSMKDKPFIIQLSNY
jgi:hypothetical protein